MDNSAVGWAPKPALVLLGWLGALVAAAAAVFSPDRTGAVLFTVVAVLLALLATHGTLVRPRLAAGPAGLCIRTLRGRVDLEWSQALATLRNTRRLGRDTTTLEISAGEHLFVFGWLELGADPRDVLDELLAVRP